MPLPEVAAIRKKLGVPASRKHIDGTDFLTLPILHDLAIKSSATADEPEGTLIGDSFDIAIYLHNKHLSANDKRPPLFPPNSIALHRAFNVHVDALFNAHSLLAG